MITRGVRNNNPLNIRRTKDKWVGLRNTQTDSSFFQFIDDKYAFRAVFRIFRNYLKRNPFLTLKDLIYKWAPETENNSAGYLRFVCLHTGEKDNLFITSIIDDSIPRIVSIVRSMAYMESNKWYDSSVILQGYFLERGIKRGGSGELVPTE